MEGVRGISNVIDKVPYFLLHFWSDPLLEDLDLLLGLALRHKTLIAVSLLVGEFEVVVGILLLVLLSHLVHNVLVVGFDARREILRIECALQCAN